MMGMPTMVMVIIIAAVCIIVLGPILFMVGRGVMFGAMKKRMGGSSTDGREVTVPATVIGKRAEVSGMRGGSTSTWYYVAFETDARQRIELMTYGNDYGILFEGDRGLLTYRGDTFVSFQRY